MRAAIVVCLITAPAIAHAHPRHCEEVSSVVGDQQCSRFGDRWSGVTLGWELGMTTSTFQLDPIDEDVMTRDGARHVSATAQPDMTVGASLRLVYNLTPHFHLVSELVGARLLGEPNLTVASPREMSPIAGTFRGYRTTDLLGAGAHTSVAGITLGSELGIGPRVLLFETAQLPGTWFGQGGLAVAARVTASMWLSPHWSLGALVSTDMLARQERTVTLSLGLHAFPFDGGR